MAGASSVASDCWADWRVVEGVSSKCRVLDRTFFSRGKSLVPCDNIVILESNRDNEDRREDTEEAREFNAWLCVGCCEFGIKERECSVLFGLRVIV